MNADELEAHIREIAEDDGSTIEDLEISQDDLGWHASIKAEGNPFSRGDFGSMSGKEDMIIPLRGRECKYHSLRSGEMEIEAFPGLHVVWFSTVEAWDEYTDAPDTHRIDAVFVEAVNLEKARTVQRDELEGALIGEIAGDLYSTSRLLDHLSRPVDQQQRDALAERLAQMMRTLLCTSKKT